MLQDNAHIARQTYFDRELGAEAVKVLPGEYYATADGTAIVTLLGSCVSVCLYDPTTGVGGMNHFMLPELLRRHNATHCPPRCAAGCERPCSARYGSCAMKHLLELLERLGARPGQLEAKVFGGGRVMESGSDIGERNAAFALGYLRERGIPVVASDLGGAAARKVILFPNRGRVLVRHPGRVRKMPWR